MYTRISIKNFRAIASLEATDLRPINLIVGRNNCARPRSSKPCFCLAGLRTRGCQRRWASCGQRLNRISSDQFWHPSFTTSIQACLLTYVVIGMDSLNRGTSRSRPCWNRARPGSLVFRRRRRRGGLYNARHGSS